MGSSITFFKIEQKDVLEEIKKNLELLKSGLPALKIKTVKAGYYSAVLPLDDLEIRKGVEIYLVQLGQNIWLLIPEDGIK